MRNPIAAAGAPTRALGIVRIVTGVLVAPHGIQKILRGPAAAIGGAIASKGLPAPSVLAWIVTLGELSGILLALGLFTRFAGAAIALTMGAIVFSVHLALLANPGTGTSVAAEYPLLLAVIGAVFAVFGPGAWSLDARRGR